MTSSDLPLAQSYGLTYGWMDGSIELTAHSIIISGSWVRLVAGSSQRSYLSTLKG